MTTCGGLDYSRDRVDRTLTAGGPIHKTKSHIYMYYYLRFLEHHSEAKQSNIILY
jgi:hypothetical protein